MKTKANFIYVKVEPLNLVTKRLKIVTDFPIVTETMKAVTKFKPIDIEWVKDVRK